MMNDRELLELAAKAAGIEVVGVAAEGIPHRFGGGYWSPLTDDGDALRLFVELGLTVKVGKQSGFSWVKGFEGSISHKGDPYAATRRAIVRAAAEIGKQMGGE